MDFFHFLSTHLLDPSVGGKQLFKNSVDQAIHAEACGYKGVAIPEHHLVNILLVPSPLQLAVKIAAHTKHIQLMTSVCQLPIRDMRVFAGEVVQAQALCDGRLMLGVGKGAFGCETARLDIPIEKTKHKFEESLAVLEALLTQDSVSWRGDYYNFEDVTVMPRPQDPIPLMAAIMVPPGIEAAARKGYHVQTTPLSGAHQQLMEQVNAFYRGKAAAGPNATNKLSLQRGVYLVRSDAERQRMVALAYEYYKSFDNVFGGPGILDKGMIRPLPRTQTIEELGNNILICQKDEMIDRLSAYAEIGIDDVILTSIFGQPQADTLEMMSRLSSEVFPQVRTVKCKAA